MRINGELVVEILADGSVMGLRGNLLHICRTEEERMRLVRQMLEED